VATKKPETQAEELKRLKVQYEKALKTHKNANTNWTAAREQTAKYQLSSDYGTGKKAKDTVKSQQAASNARLNQQEQRIEDLQKAIKLKKSKASNKGK